MNLSKTPNPLRQLSWNGKSLANCSREELQACVLHLARQVAFLEAKSKELEMKSKTLREIAEEAVKNEPTPNSKG
jgi:hypothetical protein